MTTEWSEEQWLALWKHIGARGDGRAAYQNLVEHYAEPHRAYHTLAHIAHCLRELAQVRHLALNPDAVEMALWYHDVVYDTHAKDNEEKSSGFAAMVLVCDAYLPSGFAAEVVRLILVTRHVVIPKDLNAQLVADIDLSSLGLSEDEFEENSRNIRREYQWVTQDEFNKGRRTFLESLLGRPRIYTTDFFHHKYEVQARRNIANSLARLEA